MIHKAINRDLTKSFSLLIIAALIYGLLFPLNNVAASSGASFFGNAFWQTFLGGFYLLLIILFKREKFRLSKKHFLCFVIVGATGFGLPMALITAVSPKLPIGLTSLVMALSPTCTYLLSVFLKLDKLSIFGALGIFLGLCGVLVIIIPELGVPDSSVIGWFALALITPFMLAIANVSTAILRPPETTTLNMGAGFLLGASIVILPLMVITNQAFIPSSTTIFLTVNCAGLVNAVFIILFAEIVRLYGPTFFSQFNYLTVLAAIFWALIFLSEIPTVTVFIALVLMAVGVIVAQRNTR